MTGSPMISNKPRLALPTAMTGVVSSFELCTTLYYGPFKIGKSTLASSYPNPLFVMTEEGLKFVSAYKMPCDSWDDFRDISAQFRAGAHKFRTLVVDTVDVLWQQCEDWVCKKNGLEHLSDEDWGKGYDKARKEFMSAIAPLTRPAREGGHRYGVVFLSHERTSEVKGRAVKTLRVTPTIPGGGRKVILPMVDVIGHCGFEILKNGEVTDKRVIHFHPSDEIEAGDRTGRLPAQVPLLKVGGYAKINEYFSGNRAQTDDNAGKESSPRRGPKRRA